MNKREIATVLAALRYWQDEYRDYPEITDTPHFDECTPLEDDEIDALCEKLNFGPKRKARKVQP